MDKNNLTQTLAAMRARYLDNGACENDRGTCSDIKKVQKIKQKLMHLERERCHKMIEKKDVSAINEKIKAQKRLYASLRQE